MKNSGSDVGMTLIDLKVTGVLEQGQKLVANT